MAKASAKYIAKMYDARFLLPDENSSTVRWSFRAWHYKRGKVFSGFIELRDCANTVTWGAHDLKEERSIDSLRARINVVQESFAEALLALNEVEARMGSNK